MNEIWTPAGRWLLHTAIGGDLLLLVTCLLMRWTRQPARRQRLGDWGVSAALLVGVLSLLGPSWLVVSWTRSPAELAPGQAAVQPDSPAPVEFASTPAADGPETQAQVLRWFMKVDDKTALAAVPKEEQVETAGSGPGWKEWLEPIVMGALLAYVAAATLLALRLLAGYVGLLRLLLRSEAAPAEVRGLFEQMAAGTRWVRLLVSRRLLVPLSCGLVRPTVVLPSSLCQQHAPRQLRWIFAHELTHLQRRDAWSALLFNVGQIFFFYWPWFWWLRRQVRLCQEYVADAAAVEQDQQAVSYAEFLLSLANTPALPAGATGVSGNGSDLLRRVTMLLKDPLRVETRCPRLWTLFVAGGLMLLAVLVAGFGYRAEAATDDPILLVIRPEGEKAKIEKRQTIRVFVTPVDSPKGQGNEDLILWSVVDDEHQPKGGKKDARDSLLRAADAKLVEVLIEQVGPGYQWAYRVKQTDNLEPLYDALKCLELLKKEGKLTSEAIQKEVMKALEKMKAQPASPTFRMPIRMEWKTIAPENQYKLLIPRDAGWNLKKEQLDDAVKNLPDKKDQSYADAVRQALQFLGQQQAPPVLDLEILPIEGDGKDKKSPKKVESLEEVRKLVRQLEQLREKQAGPAEQWRLVTRRHLAQLALSDTTAKPRLGVSVEVVPAAMADQLNLPKDIGVLVTEVIADTPAARLGLKANDILIKIGGAMVPGNVDDFGELIAGLKGDTEFDIVVVRKGQQQKLGSLKLATDIPAGSDKFRLWMQPDKAEVKLIELWLSSRAELDKAAKVKHVPGSRALLVLKHQDGKVTMTITGELQDGKFNVTEIEIQEGDVTRKYHSVDRVPEKFRRAVTQIVDALQGNTYKFQTK
jgi:beta-lactamase regulating signal transducer with metallopeptidase domain